MRLIIIGTWVIFMIHLNLVESGDRTKQSKSNKSKLKEPQIPVPEPHFNAYVAAHEQELLDHYNQNPHLYQSHFGQHQDQIAPHQGQFAAHQGQFAPHQEQFVAHQGQFAPHQGQLTPHQGQFVLHQEQFVAHQDQFAAHPGHFVSQQGQFGHNQGYIDPYGASSSHHIAGPLEPVVEISSESSGGSPRGSPSAYYHHFHGSPSRYHVPNPSGPPPLHDSFSEVASHYQFAHEPFLIPDNSPPKSPSLQAYHGGYDPNHYPYGMSPYSHEVPLHNVPLNPVPPYQSPQQNFPQQHLPQHHVPTPSNSPQLPPFPESNIPEPEEGSTHYNPLRETLKGSSLLPPLPKSYSPTKYANHEYYNTAPDTPPHLRNQYHDKYSQAGPSYSGHDQQGK